MTKNDIIQLAQAKDVLVLLLSYVGLISILKQCQ